MGSAPHEDVGQDRRRLGTHAPASRVRDRSSALKRRERALLGILETCALSRTVLGIRLERRGVEFDYEAKFDDTNRSQELNRTSTAASLDGPARPHRHDDADARNVSRQQERFDEATFRDATSMMLGFACDSLDPVALISRGRNNRLPRLQPRVLRPCPAYHGMTACGRSARTSRSATLD